MKALFIGRFQPFHKGHLQALQHICQQYDEIIIGIGSSRDSHTIENPFTADERRSMIEKSLETCGIHNYRIVLIPDIHDYPRWVSHVLSIVSDFDMVISNSALTKRLFSEKGYRVKRTPLFGQPRYSGTDIRMRITHNNAWEDLVPDSVVAILKDLRGVQRIQHLMK